MPCRRDPEQADLVVLNTCHIRERASEKVYSELGRLRDIKASAARRVATSPSPWPAAWPRPRARRSCAASPRSTSSWARRPITGCRAVGPGGAQDGRAAGRRQAPARRRRARHRVSRREQIRPSAGAGRRARRLGLPVDPGRLRQVLHLLRRALYARRRIFAAGCGGAGRSAPSGGGGRDRDHAARPERQRLSRRGRARVHGRVRPGRWPA